MRRKLAHLVFATLLSIASIQPAAFAQTTPSTAKPTRLDENETVVLDPFTVTSVPLSRYQVGDSTSGARIRTNLMDSDASIQVIPKELIEDVGATVILDAAKYAAGVTESNAPNALDRVTVRGFQTDGQTVDGFYFLGASNYDPALVERMEIVKGPNAVLAPTGTPGGTINLVTKKPSFKPAGQVMVQTGLYDANRIMFDQTGPLGKLPVAYRVVTAAQDSSGPFDNFFRKSFVVAPSVTVRPFPRTQVTLQGEYQHWESIIYSGLPLDPSVGTNDEAHIWSGVDENLGLYEADEHRDELKRSANMQITSSVGQHLSVRLAGRVLSSYLTNLQINNGLNTTGGSYNPFTGEWDAGLNWTGSGGNFTSAPATQPSRTVTRAGTYQTQGISRWDLQNDYVWDQDFKGLKSLTTAGFQYSYYHQITIQQNVSRGTQNLDALAPPPAVVYAPINFGSNGVRKFRQYYAVEKLMAFDKRLILSVGATRLTSFGTNLNILTGGRSTAPRSKDGLNYGVVIKPVKNMSLFYAFAESALPITDFAGVSSGNVQPFLTGTQKEGGVRVQLNDGKVMVTASYFDIKQNNYVIPNPANLAVPPPPIPLPALFSDRFSKGWEINFTAEIARNLSLVGNVTRFKNRDPNDVRFRSTAEDSAAVYARYDFRKGAAKGFAIAVGADYMGKRAGDQASGLAQTSTPTNVIPRQPSFYLPARTLTNLFLSYNYKRSTVGVAIANLFDEEYLTTALNRNSVWPGFRRNVKVSYSFRY